MEFNKDYTFTTSWKRNMRELHESKHWQVDRVDHSRTKSDFYSLPKNYQEVLLRILMFFTEADIQVRNNYIDRLLPYFVGKDYDTTGMLLSFANREHTHSDAYAKLVDQLDLTVEEKNEFIVMHKNIENMARKVNFLQVKEDIPTTLVKFGAFTEGLQLFSSFLILYEAGRSINGGKLQGLTETIEWSLLDEVMHYSSLIRLYHEMGDDVNYADISNMLDRVEELEHAFIDYVMEPLNGESFFTLSKQDIYDYIKYVIKQRVNDLGFDCVYDMADPQPHMTELQKTINANFFESNVTQYVHGNIKGNFPTNYL